MTLHMKEAKRGIRKLARLNAVGEGIQPLSFAPFPHRDSSSTTADAHLLYNMGGRGGARVWVCEELSLKNIKAENLMV